MTLSLGTMRSSLVRRLERVVRRIPYARDALDVVAPTRSVATLTEENTLAAYDRVYSSDRLVREYVNPERVAFYEELAALFAPLAPRSVIDVGCGTGHLLRLTIDRLAAVPERVVGVDHSEAGIQRARELFPAARWVVADLHTFQVDERFDLVICTEVLEHLQHPGRAVELLLSLCAHGGRVAITVPDGAEDSWEGHVNFWDEAAFHRFLEPFGLSAVERVEDGRALLAWLSPG